MYGFSEYKTNDYINNNYLILITKYSITTVVMT